MNADARERRLGNNEKAASGPKRYLNEIIRKNGVVHSVLFTLPRTEKPEEYRISPLFFGFYFVWRLPIFTFTLSSAFNGLTSVFEMGTGVTHWLSSPYRSVLRLNHLIMDLSKTNTSFDITLVSNSYDFTSFMKSEDCLWLSFLSMILTIRASTLYLVILD